MLLPMPPSFFGVLGLLLALVLRATAQECTAGGDDTCQATPLMECGVYMAPSTLGETTNMGFYAGMPVKMNETLNYPEIVRSFECVCLLKNSFIC
jgi:hypothetical protein